MLRRFLTRKWILTSLLVIAGAALCIRLGFWQLDRLAWRRSFNARVEDQINAPVHGPEPEPYRSTNCMTWNTAR